MNTIMGVCTDCGRILVLRGESLCRQCKAKLRVCCACRSWFNKERMVHDRELQYPYYPESDYFYWVCLGCATGRQKANV